MFASATALAKIIEVFDMAYGEIFKVDEPKKRVAPKVYTMTLIGKNGRVCSTQKVKRLICFADVADYVRRCKVVNFRVFAERKRNRLLIGDTVYSTDGLFKHQFPVQCDITIVEV